MYCEQCQREVTSQKNPHTGALQCSQCGTEKQTPVAANTQTIAQTAQALLKRWEASRPQLQADQSPAPADKTGETSSARSRSVQSEAGIDISSYLAELEQEFPLAEEKVPLKKSFQLDRPKENSQQANRTSAPVSTPKPASPQPELESLPLAELPAPAHRHQPVQTTVPEKPTLRADETLPAEMVPAQRPSSKLPEPRKQRETEEPDLLSYKEALLQSVAEQQQPPKQNLQPKPAAVPAPFTAAVTEESKPSIPAESPAKAPARPEFSPPQPQMSVPASPQSVAPQGKVRFAAAAVEKVEDFDIQQAIERHHRKQRNWSALLGQFLAFSGALAMTGGVAIVVGNRFGSLDIAETTGWLSMAGGHLLFILGIYTHLTSRMEQVWHDLHQRTDDLARLLLQQQKMQQKLAQQASRAPRTEFNESFDRTTADMGNFQRGTLTKAS